MRGCIDEGNSQRWGMNFLVCHFFLVFVLSFLFAKDNFGCHEKQERQTLKNTEGNAVQSAPAKIKILLSRSKKISFFFFDERVGALEYPLKNNVLKPVPPVP